MWYPGSFVSPLHTFPLVGNKNVHTTSQNTNSEKYFFLSKHQIKNADFRGIKDFPLHFLPTRPPPFQFLNKNDGLNPSQMDIEVLIPVLT